MTPDQRATPPRAGGPLRGLDDDAARELVADRAGTTPADGPPAQLVRTAAGNPLALTELTGELDASQLAGRAALPEPLALGPRARREPAGTGERARRRAPDTHVELTPQERQIAVTVAGGATNREAAAALFLSPKTVENHLGRVYAKLGVRSRTELGARLRAGLGR